MSSVGATDRAEIVEPRRELPVGFEWMRAISLAQRAQRRLKRTSATTMLLLAVIIWAGVTVWHLVILQHRFGTFDHDLGVWDQAVWLLSRGESLITSRGLDVFGFHACIALYLYVPFYWLGAGPDFLNTSMALMYGAGAFAVFGIAKHYLRNQWHALILALAFLFNYAGNWLVKETFHPETMAITPLLFAYLAAIKGRWRSFTIWMVFALSWKEDVALAGFMLGLVLVIRGTRTVTDRIGPAASRRYGFYTMAACLLWFYAVTRILIPANSAEGNFTDNYFGDLGATPTEMARTAVTDPEVVGRHFEQSNPGRYALELTGSFGFAAVAAPLAIVIGIPQATINLLAVHNFFWPTRVHYAAIPLLAVVIASVEGVARFRSLPFRRLALGCVAVGVFYTGVNWGTTPVSPEYRTGIWTLNPLVEQEEVDAALALPGPDHAVSALTNYVPHLAHRSEIYTFPNPWVAVNWGVRSENRPDPNNVDWLIVKPSALGASDASVLETVLDDPTRYVVPNMRTGPPRRGDFAHVANPERWKVVSERPHLFVAKRVRE